MRAIVDTLSRTLTVSPPYKHFAVASTTQRYSANQSNVSNPAFGHKSDPDMSMFVIISAIIFCAAVLLIAIMVSCRVIKRYVPRASDMHLEGDLVAHTPQLGYVASANLKGNASSEQEAHLVSGTNATYIKYEDVGPIDSQEGNDLMRQVHDLRKKCLALEGENQRLDSSNKKFIECNTELFEQNCILQNYNNMLKKRRCEPYEQYTEADMDCGSIAPINESHSSTISIEQQDAYAEPRRYHRSLSCDGSAYDTPRMSYRDYNSIATRNKIPSCDESASGSMPPTLPPRTKMHVQRESGLESAASLVGSTASNCV